MRLVSVKSSHDTEEQSKTNRQTDKPTNKIYEIKN